MDWNLRYLQGDTPWDKNAPAPPLLDILSQRGALFPKDKAVLVPGCGAGHDVKVLAAHGCQVTGLDIAPEALALAQRSESNHHNIQWLLGNFFDPNLPKAKLYKTIWEHTCFCAIEPDLREDYVQSAWNLLEANGKLIGIFFLDTGQPPEEGPPFSSDRAELKELFGELFSLEWEGPPQQCYPGREGREWMMVWRKLAICTDSEQSQRMLC